MLTLCRFDINRKICSIRILCSRSKCSVEWVWGCESERQRHQGIMLMWLLVIEHTCKRLKRSKRLKRFETSIDIVIHFRWLHQFTKRLLETQPKRTNSNLNGYLHHFFHSSALPLDIRCAVHTLNVSLWVYFIIHERNKQRMVFSRTNASASVAGAQHIKIYLNRCETVSIDSDSTLISNDM